MFRILLNIIAGLLLSITSEKPSKPAAPPISARWKLKLMDSDETVYRAEPQTDNT